MRLGLIFAFLLFLELSLSFTTTSEATGTDKKVKTKVLILGAGLSGITAAKTLLDNNIKDFYVLEGQDYIGGRIHAVQFEGGRVEAGANWVHSLDNEDSEVLVKLMSDKKISGLWSNYSDFIIRDENGADVTDWKVFQKFKKTVAEKLEDFQWHRKKRNMPQIPARVGLQLMGWKSESPVEKVLEYFKIDFTHSKNPELISFHNLIGEGKDFVVSDQRGLWFMYKSLYRRVKKKVLLKKTVDRITYSGNSVVIQTKENETFVADYALCTFSTGVLASDSITFNPPLPQWKQEAIYKNPLSVYTKIFLKFPYKFWDDNEYILYASKRRGYFPVMQNMNKEGLLPNGSKVLLVTVTGDEGRRIEGQTDEETKQEIMKTLRKIYGAGIPDPTAIFYRRWSKDPFTLGAYSEPVVGMTTEDFSNLAKNLGRLYFAGEATSEDWYGYMQGAYFTGKEQGQRIADDLLSAKR